MPGLSFRLSRGPVNSFVVEREGKRLAVYGAADCEQVLITHHRRDVVWKARTAIGGGAEAVAPKAERDLLEKPGEFWDAFTKNRFPRLRSAIHEDPRPAAGGLPLGE